MTRHFHRVARVLEGWRQIVEFCMFHGDADNDDPRVCQFIAFVDIEWIHRGDPDKVTFVGVGKGLQFRGPVL